MKIADVVDRAVRDPIYALKLSSLAAEAGRVEISAEGVAGDEWSSLLGEFADGPEELGRLVASYEARADGSPWWTTTVTSTTLTTTTAVCTTTTTTSVTTVTTATMVEEA